ncbi:hypothetical protein Acr_00g0049120 [Actinidia rufa]|uniref:Uncharacterized protein n=1 Tax=Actinidia rufa TaxID=165716 RepID=A0A7J0DLS6_9ERIC|nr:hypothetical protein Acr_00g0049120 [Actinidia rufa]
MQELRDLVDQGNDSAWKFTFRRRLFYWKYDSLQDLFNFIEGLQINPSRRDRLRWSWEAGEPLLLSQLIGNGNHACLAAPLVLIRTIDLEELMPFQD